MPTSVRQLVLFYGIGALFLALLAMVVLAAKVLVLIFASILLAILLYDTTTKLQRWLPLRRAPALALIITLFVGILGVAGWLLAPGVAEQTNELLNAIPRSLQRLRDQLERYAVLRNLLSKLPSSEDLAAQAATLMAQAGVFFTGIFGAFASVVILAFLSIYLAASPRSYIDGFLALIPPPRRGRAREVLDEIGHMLAQWLQGKLLSMVIVGTVTAIGLALLGVPLALVLGILAGLLDFIPYIGPLLAGIPAVLIAFAENPALGLYVILLFVGIQAAEGYLLLPLIEYRTVSLPPALIIAMQMVLGTFFGLPGVAIATPLTAVFAVLIAMLYVQDVLGESVEISGNGDHSATTTAGEKRKE